MMRILLPTDVDAAARVKALVDRAAGVPREVEQRAREAGVREIVMTTPGPSPEALCAARVAGVDRVFVLGGAQAVAALAFGTEQVPRVDKIVGPGNLYVAAAKRLVFGEVDIDSV